MRALLIIAVVFFSASGALIAFFASSDEGHEYDLKLVLPIDTRQMPKAVLPPPVTPTVKSEEPPSEPPIEENRAEAGSQPDLTKTPLFRFDDTQSAPNQPHAQE
jgi:hypothetical protein